MYISNLYIHLLWFLWVVVGRRNLFYKDNVTLGNVLKEGGVGQKESLRWRKNLKENIRTNIDNNMILIKMGIIL